MTATELEVGKACYDRNAECPEIGVFTEAAKNTMTERGVIVRLLMGFDDKCVLPEANPIYKTFIAANLRPVEDK